MIEIGPSLERHVGDDIESFDKERCGEHHGALIVVGVNRALAGTTGVLTGYVVDMWSHKPMAHAIVSVTSCGAWTCSANDSTTTDSHGHYVFMSLTPGYYNLSATIPSTAIVSACGPRATVDADITTFADFEMYDSLKAIVDCFWVHRVSSKPTNSVFSFDDDGNLER